MPTKRRRLAPRPAAKLTLAAVEAWKAGDYWRLHGALHVPIWLMPDFGFDPPLDDPPDWPASIEAYEYICEMQRQLIEVAGPPPRRWHYKGTRHGD
jgi:hypothetical protein